MFGIDEFGNSRLLPATFVVLFVVLSLGVVSTSQTLWSPQNQTMTMGVTGR